MFFLRPRNVQCPHCKHSFFVDFQGSSENQHALKHGTSFQCPKCEQHSNYPRYADTLFSLGLLTAVILMPAEFHYAVLGIPIPALAFIATCLVISGSFMRRLKKTDN